MGFTIMGQLRQNLCLYTDLTLISFNVLWHQLICLMLPADRVAVPKKIPRTLTPRTAC